MIIRLAVLLIVIGIVVTLVRRSRGNEQSSGKVSGFRKPDRGGE